VQTFRGRAFFVDEENERDEDEILVLAQQQIVAPYVPTTTSPTIDHPHVRLISRLDQMIKS
jgi:hypothetical protein